jgi:hypothetical protein
MNGFLKLCRLFYSTLVYPTLDGAWLPLTPPIVPMLELRYLYVRIFTLGGSC